MTSMTLVCPITTRDNGFPLHIALPPESETQGFVATEQVRAFDLAAREAKHLEYLDEESGFVLNLKQLLTSFF